MGSHTILLKKNGEVIFEKKVKIAGEMVTTVSRPVEETSETAVASELAHPENTDGTEDAAPPSSAP